MADVMSRHHRGDGGDEQPRHPSTVPSNCESAQPPKMRQNSKSLTVYQPFNKLGGPIPIQLDLESLKFYSIGQYSEHYVQHIGNLI